MNDPTHRLETASPMRSLGRAGFTADLAFAFCVAWLLLWRAELFTAASGSIWLGWWPAVVLGGLLLAALGIGLTHRHPRAFFPVTLRWVGLTACLILPVWIAFSIADAAPATSLKHAADQLRTSGAELQRAAKTQEQVREAESVVETSDAVERLALALGAAKDRGIAVPRKPLTEMGFTPEDVAELPAPTKDLLEQGAGLMELQKQGLPPPAGFADLMREFGLDNPLIQKALIGLAAATLGPLIGVSPALIEVVFAALLAGGELSWDNIFDVAVALALSSTKAGNLSATKFKRNLNNIHMGREVITKIHEGLTSRGVSADSKGMQALREASSGPASTRRSAACEQAITASGATRARLQRACPELTPREIEVILGARP